jgi:hypothetical protein
VVKAKKKQKKKKEKESISTKLYCMHFEKVFLVFCCRVSGVGTEHRDSGEE